MPRRLYYGYAYAGCTYARGCAYMYDICPWLRLGLKLCLCYGYAYGYGNENGYAAMPVMHMLV